MSWTSGRWLAFAAVTALCALALAPTAQAEDFLSALFGAFGGGRPQAPAVRLPFGNENDPTLRKGDIVAGSDGLVVAGRGADKRGASLNFSPASLAVRARYQRVPVLAAE